MVLKQKANEQFQKMQNWALYKMADTYFCNFLDFHFQVRNIIFSEAIIYEIKSFKDIQKPNI